MPVRSVPRRAAAVLLVLLLTALVASCGTDPGTRTMARALPPGAPFTHPGVLVSQAQLDVVRKNVIAGKQPWLQAFLDMRDSKYGSYKYTAQPTAVVNCPWGGKGAKGCLEERQDAIAAYTQALLYSVTRQHEHAVKAREIMDAWSAQLKRHTAQDARLQSSWAGSTWARAAEIIRYTPGADWPADRVRRFAAMLRTAYLPEVTRNLPDYNGNWDLAMTDAAIGIAVFTDDHKTFDAALKRFRGLVPDYFYLRKDGKIPLTPAGSDANTVQKLETYWFKETKFEDGIAQETCRNFKHVGYSLAATAHIAETAWHQGVDLYGDVKDRLKAALDFHARYEMGAKPPRWLCGGRVVGNMGPDLEVALNHLENRLGTPVPAAHKLVEQTRPAGTDDLFVSWETLTHADNPAA
ncbi:alginate lyase family protein [Streptomyces sp. NPDC001537]